MAILLIRVVKHRVDPGIFEVKFQYVDSIALLFRVICPEIFEYIQLKIKVKR